MSEIPDPRLEGGLWCQEVLDRLEAYVADALADEDRAAVEAHLRACGQCASFGGSYTELVRALRRQLGEVPELDEALAARLHDRLRRVMEGT